MYPDMSPFYLQNKGYRCARPSAGLKVAGADIFVVITINLVKIAIVFVLLVNIFSKFPDYSGMNAIR